MNILNFLNNQQNHFNKDEQVKLIKDLNYQSLHLSLDDKNDPYLSFLLINLKTEKNFHHFLSHQLDQIKMKDCDFTFTLDHPSAYNINGSVVDGNYDLFFNFLNEYQLHFLRENGKCDLTYRDYVEKINYLFSAHFSSLLFIHEHSILNKKFDDFYNQLIQDEKYTNLLKNMKENSDFNLDEFLSIFTNNFAIKFPQVLFYYPSASLITNNGICLDYSILDNKLNHIQDVWYFADYDKKDPNEEVVFFNLTETLPIIKENYFEKNDLQNVPLHILEYEVLNKSLYSKDLPKLNYYLQRLTNVIKNDELFDNYGEPDTIRKISEIIFINTNGKIIISKNEQDFLKNLNGKSTQEKRDLLCQFLLEKDRFPICFNLKYHYIDDKTIFFKFYIIFNCQNNVHYMIDCKY